MWSCDTEVPSVVQEALEQRGGVARILLKTREVRVVVVGMPRERRGRRTWHRGRVVLRGELGSVSIRTAAGDPR